METGSGNITSPNYPLKYPAEEECTWTILVPEGMRIALRFKTFLVCTPISFLKIETPIQFSKICKLQLESGRDCEFDYVEIRDGGNSQAAKIGKYCGKVAPKNIVSTSNQLYMKFASDSSVAKKGFSASFVTLKGKLYHCKH